MELTGKTLKHYRIVAQIGKGGMGEVYAAEDLKLGRKVALKILPPGLADHPDRRMRFEREARAVAALNHPNIVTIFSVENAEGIHFLTMEMVQGKALSRLIPRGLELDRLLSLAVTMADAVGAAHKKDIVHRDLKPDNLVVGEDGRLKVLDFGLAKLKVEPSQPVTATQLPTEAVTQEGKILGTVSYMSPEQAEGKPVDARSDIFSLGVVLYEMATGQRPFAGDTPVSTISAILKDTPDSVLELNRNLPRHLGRIVSRCLAKDPDRRYQTAIDLRNDLEVLAEEVRSGEAVAVGEVTGVGGTSRRSWVVVGLMLLVVLAIGYGLSSRLLDRGDEDTARPFEGMKITRLTTDGSSEEPTISSDGKYVAYVRNDAAGYSLRLRQVSLPSSVEIVPPTHDSLFDPTFSPEGDQIYYLVSPFDTMGVVLRRVPVLGGPSIAVLDDVRERISFSPDGDRFAFLRWVPPAASRLMVADRNGENVRIVAERKEPDEFVGDPAWSPDGSVIATATVRWTGRMRHALVTVSAEGGPERPISTRTWDEIGELAWLPDGSGLVFDAREGTYGAAAQLWEISYPQGSVRRITNDLNSYEGAGLTADGRSLVTELNEPEYVLWTAEAADPTVTAVRLTSGSKRDDRFGISWTPDGRIVHSSNVNGKIDLWITDPAAGDSTQLTFEGGSDPSVCPDGRTVVFVSRRSGSDNIWRMNLDGSDKIRLTSGEADGRPQCHPDGKRVIYKAQGETLVQVSEVPIDGGEPTTLVPEERGTSWWSMDVSPDGKSLAHLVWEETTRRWQLEVLPLGETGSVRRFEITTSFGASSWASVRWSPDGESIHYVDHERGVGNLWSRPLDGSPPRPVTTFQSGRMANFAWSPDGSRLAVARGRRIHDIVLLENFR